MTIKKLKQAIEEISKLLKAFGIQIEHNTRIEYKEGKNAKSKRSVK